MKAHWRTGMLLALGLTGCASQVPREAPQQTKRIDSVDQRMLETGFGAAPGAAAVQSYQMQPQQVFRMPQPLQAPTPQLPADSPRRSLAPTTVCVRVILSAQGAVERSALLDDRPDCSAGAQPEMADLLQAVQDAVAQWRFVPAAICTYADPAQRPAQDGRCDDAQSVQEVPVTLAYAFTFEVRQGKVSVQSGRVSGVR
ncbi:MULTISPECIES: hypothetical protein [unclassified Xanthomonas]|uniref:hypothetical protein n=1 Tax=Xanthomonas sp. LMG 9002 TaxID=1591158 RepID=UPI00136AEFE5|nr:hypothetical protein [Xanthomonas sp. LMG 9002]MXV06213.1 hypothetical protein [Xanthomonas sp. LMG 9002]